MSSFRGDRLALGAVAFGVCGLALVASRLDIDYWDAFDYLRNAMHIAHPGEAMQHISVGYNDVRPPVVSMWMALAYGICAPGAMGCVLGASHLLNFAVGAAGLFATYRLLAFTFAPLESAVGTLLLLANPLFVHYSPFAMADVPSMSLLAFAVGGYLAARARGSVWTYVAAGLAAGAALATKYPLLVLGGAAGLFELARTLRPTPSALPTQRWVWRRLSDLVVDWRPWLTLGAALALFAAIHLWVYERVPRPDDIDPWSRFQQTLAGGLFAGAQGQATDPLWEYASELVFLFSWPMVVLAGLGIVRGLVAWTDSDVFHICWVAVFLGVMTFKVAHKEARYLMPILPSLIYLQLRGFQWVRGALPSFALRPNVEAAGVAALLVMALHGGLAEAARWLDPVYAKPCLSAMAQWINERVGPQGRVLVGGTRAYTLYSRDPVVMPMDEYNHFHHINPNTVEYFLGRRVEQSDAPLTREAFPNGGALITFPDALFEARIPHIAEPPIPFHASVVPPPSAGNAIVSTREFRFR